MILIRVTILTSLTVGAALIYAGAWPWLDMSGLAVPALLGAMLVLHVAARLTDPQPEPEPPLPPLPQPRRPLPAPAPSAFLLPLGEGVDGVAMPSPASSRMPRAGSAAIAGRLGGGRCVRSGVAWRGWARHDRPGMARLGSASPGVARQASR